MARNSTTMRSTMTTMTTMTITCGAFFFPQFQFPFDHLGPLVLWSNAMPPGHSQYRGPGAMHWTRTTAVERQCLRSLLGLMRQRPYVETEGATTDGKGATWHVSILAFFNSSCHKWINWRSNLHSPALQERGVHISPACLEFECVLQVWMWVLVNYD